MNGIIASIDTTTLSLIAALIVIVGGGLFFSAAVAQRMERKRLTRRLGAIAWREQLPTLEAHEVTVRRDLADSSIETLDKLIKQLLPRPAKLRERLAATGKQISISEYLLFSLLVGLIMFALRFVLFKKNLILALLLAFTAMIGLPHKVTGIMIARRQRKFLAMFPEAIELIVRGLKSGIPISESIKVVGRELPDPVGGEFRNITDSMLLGQSFDQALASASLRINLSDFRFFEIALGIQQETGGNLAETLENLGSILRKRKQMKQKVRALSSEARASAYILGSLPFLMFLGLYVMSPEYVSILFEDPRGQVICGAAGASLAIGVGVMIRMGKFQI
jgi:tight adherence protein B